MKAIYGYFNSLPKEITAENSDLFENAKEALINYLILNDVMFTRATDQKDDPKELEALENVLSTLIDESNIKISLEDITSSIQKTNTPDNDVTVDDLREIFREHIALL